LRYERAIFAPRRQSGFTLIEVLVSLVIIAVIFTGVLALIDRSARVNKSELDTSDAQQAVRASFNQMLTFAREGASGGISYTRAIVPLFDNAPAGNFINDDNGTAQPIRPGTDAFLVRGVLTTTVSGLNTIAVAGGPPIGFDPSASPTQPTISVAFQPAVTDALHQISNFNTLATGYNFSGPTDPIVVALTDSTIGATNKRFYVVSDPSTGTYSAFALRRPASCYSGGVVQAQCTSATDTLIFTGYRADADNAAGRFDLDSNNPPDMQFAALGGVAEEYVYFIRDSASHPTLMQGRLVDMAGGIPRYHMEPVSEDIEDLQVSYYVTPTANQAYTAAENRTAPGADFWVPNVSGETMPDPQTFVDPLAPYATDALKRTANLKGIRIAVVAKSANPDPSARGSRYAFGTLDGSGQPTIENSGATINTAVSTTIPYRRRVIDVSFDLRNYN
jgi:prepilin-type N-terminal cleavage/methylation domain-containing protein